MVCGASPSATASTISPRIPCSSPAARSVRRMVSMDASTFTEEAIMSINVRLLTVSLAILLACSTTPGWGAGSSAGASRGGADAANLDYQAGLAAAQAKDWTVVVARMTAVTQQDPKNANAWNELGHAYRLLGDMDNSF